MLLRWGLWSCDFRPVREGDGWGEDALPGVVGRDVRKGDGMFLPPCLFWWWVEQLWQLRGASEKVEGKENFSNVYTNAYNFGNIFGARII